MNRYTEEEDDVQFSEPILAQKGVRCGITGAEKGQWEIKNKASWTPEQSALMKPLLGKTYDVLKLKVTISDDSVKTEHADAKPKLSIDDQFNIEAYPYPDKKTGAISKMGKQKLYQLETAFGFDPCFEVDGQPVEPFINKVGNKVAPKIKDKDVKRKINPNFFNTYFDSNGNPNVSNFVGKTIWADIDVEKSEQFGAKNVIDRYVKEPITI